MLESFIGAICNWVKKVSGGYFFIVIGDDKVSHVAWANAEKLALHGAIAISSEFKSVAALQTIQVGVDFLTEEENLSPEYKKERDENCMVDVPDGWFSVDNCNF